MKTMLIEKGSLKIAQSGLSQYDIGFTVSGKENLQSILRLDKEKQIDVAFKHYRQKRSLDANSYYWVLNGKLADAMRISKEECHLLMLQRYGQTDTYSDGTPMIITIKADIPAEEITEHLDAYVAPIKNGVVGDKEFTHYRVLKGTHKYNTKEMSVFIDGVVSECKELGIETMTPDELEQLKQQWNVT